MVGTERHIAERIFHDQQACQRAESFRIGAAQLTFAQEWYLDHETWVRFAFGQLGELRGRHVLDYGCGHGMAAVTMARAGALVTACDLSPGYVHEARQRALANGVAVECVVANGEELPFAAATFDAIWGHAILHHLDLVKAGRELRRVLKPGGVAVLCEPWGGNPLLRFARAMLPYPGKHRTADEQPLTARDLQPLRKLFGHMELYGFQLLGMIRRLGHWPQLLRVLDGIDTQLLNRWPSLKNWCRYMVIVLRLC
ncbi:MAG: class I SAM-dependent methyltransferase [Gemmataceae bacterium]|nr:class I SAM-dependent methyltransferase [Gemmata sp.]MDW8198356.1 class I SAM-dependent methyltransferase [Gemmataceae bacterium]